MKPEHSSEITFIQVYLLGPDLGQIDGVFCPSEVTDTCRNNAYCSVLHYRIQCISRSENSVSLNVIILLERGLVLRI